MDVYLRRLVWKTFSSSKLHLLVTLFLNVFAIKANSSWLVIGNIAVSGPFGRHMCDQISLAPQQRDQCERDPQTMASVRDGARLGIQECQFQFRNNRWNCSTFSKTTFINDQIIQRGSQETAFVHAIASAGVTYAVTQACSRGDLEGCSCDRKKRGPGGNASFVWGGCSDDIKYGMNFAQKFIDACEMGRHDARANMNRHNNKVGRRAVKKSVRRRCKCHGPTASCPTRTCWDELEDFRRTGEYLKSQYNKAAHVTVRQDGSIVKLSPENNGVATNRKPRKEQLVYLEGSPNYCVRNPITGSLGTAGRECNNTSRGKDSCEHLCCGRGYDTTRVTRVEECSCKFHWCCEVVCQTCRRELDVHTCKPEVEGDRAGRVIVVKSAGLPTNPHPTHSPSPSRKSKGKGRKRKGKGRKKGSRRGRKKRKKTQESSQPTTDAVRSKRDLNSEAIGLNEPKSSQDTSHLFGHIDEWDEKENDFYWPRESHKTVKPLSGKELIRFFTKLNQQKHLDQTLNSKPMEKTLSERFKQFWTSVFGKT